MVGPVPTDAKPHPTRAFGRFELRRLLGRSDATMSWLAFDPRVQRELVLGMPRVPPVHADALEAWLRDARMAARLNHPHLAAVVEVGVQDHWPFVAMERSLGQTLAEWLDANPKPSPDAVAAMLGQALEGLAFAHEAGVVHHDLQLQHLLVDEQGSLRVAALDICPAAAESPRAGASPADAAEEPNAGPLRTRRLAAERDVLALGVLLHHLLAGQPALDEPDTARVIKRLYPHGRDILRLPWATPHPVDDAMRAIVNRATGRHPRQRYLSARTFLRAIDGWREASAQDKGGPLVLLLDRLHSVGHLPALPGVGMLALRFAGLEARHIGELADQVLRDMALSFELLRRVNSAHVQGTQVSGNGPVLTIRRALALVGVNGVREAVTSLRAWPGPLNERSATDLMHLMDRVRLAGHLAQALRPAGYDPEVVYLITLLQNLGRLMVQYHFPDEARQIVGLMQPTPATESGGPEAPGMSEEAASYAVLGVDIESLGAAVARHWGLNEEVLHMIRRLPTDHPVRTADGDADLLRMTASAANEAVDIVTQAPPARLGAALAGVEQRYARALNITLRDITDGLKDARSELAPAAAAPSRDDAGDAARREPAASDLA